MKNEEKAMLLAKLNHEHQHEMYWRGRADIFDRGENKVCVWVNESYASRIAPIMLEEGYRLLTTESENLGDDDCPKLTAMTTWEKVS